MKHLEDFLNEAADENSSRTILQDLITVSNNSRLTNEIAGILAKSLSKEDFQKLKTWLNHAKNQQFIKISSASRKGPNGSFYVH
jgi:hypothetical protein